MKKTLILLSLLTLNISYAYCQNDSLFNIMPLKNGEVYYERIINIDSTGKSEIYKRVKRWYANTYNDSKSVIDLDDKDNGEFISKGIIKYYYSSFIAGADASIYHKINIKIRDNKLKVTLTNITMEFYNPGGQDSRGSNVVWTMQQLADAHFSKQMKIKQLKNIDFKIESLLNTLNDAVQTKDDKDDF